MQVPGGGSRRRMVALCVASVSSVSKCREIAYPTTLRLQASRMAARFTKSRVMRMKVMSATHLVRHHRNDIAVQVREYREVHFLAARLDVPLPRLDAQAGFLHRPGHAFVVDHMAAVLQLSS